MHPSKQSNSNVRKENLLLSIIFNLVMPIFILSKFTNYFGPMKTLFVALSFPASYAFVDYIIRRQFNPISLFGFCGTLLKGLFAFFQVDNFWFAVQEAILPIFLGTFTILSAYIKKPIVNYFIYNENIFQTDKLDCLIKEKHKEKEFQKIIWIITIVFGFVFFFGGLMNFILARIIIISPVGTKEFNHELAKMTFTGYLVVSLPKFLMSAAGLWWFVKKLKTMTGLNLEEMFKI